MRDAYRLWRPTPLYRARRLEQALGTPAKIFYKYEGVSPAGSHKPNSAVPQAYENAQAGITKLVTETGAGQWGSSLAFACSLFGLECEVFMVGSIVRPEALPALDDADLGRDRAPLAVGPDASPAARRPRTRPARWGSRSPRPSRSPRSDEDTNYALGSVLNHVLLHQTVIGQEAIAAARARGRRFPDVIVGCVGGGSNFAGLVVPVHPRDAARRELDPLRRRRARRVPDADPRRLRLRLRRHRRPDAADADAHARP